MHPALNATLFKGVGRHDFRNGMPAGSTYTRTGAATALTLAGLIQSFATDAPQRTDRGLALEPERTNVLLRSQAFDDVAWAKNQGAITANAVVAPDGLITADRFVPNTSGGAHSIYTSFTNAAVAYALSVFVQPAGYSWIKLGSMFSGSGVYFDVTNGVVGTANGGYAGSILGVANGFYRCADVFTPSAGGDSPGFYVSDVGTTVSFVGDGTSGVDPWQAQQEVGSFATSPIVTTGASATRALPVFTEPVPAGRTKALLTYADATTTLVTGLTPGGTFDVVTAVLAANKGRFGASELVTREWRA